MTEGLDIRGAVAAVILALPFVLLALAAILASRRTSPRAAEPAFALTGDAAPPAPEMTERRGEPALVAREPEPSADVSRPGPAALQPSPPQPPPLRSAPLEPAQPEVAAPREERRLVDEIIAAEGAGDHTRLAPLYLAQALGDLEAERWKDAADNLRKSITAAMRTRNSPVHARARIELAELARAAGDLTTACEHWQIARALFYDLKDKDALGSTEGQMRKHGCPTDWVLTHF